MRMIPRNMYTCIAGLDSVSTRQINSRACFLWQSNVTSGFLFIHKMWFIVSCTYWDTTPAQQSLSINPLESKLTEESTLLNLTQEAVVAGETPYEGPWRPTPCGPDGLMGSEQMCQFLCVYECVAGREMVCLSMTEWKRVIKLRRKASVILMDEWWVKAPVQLRWQAFGGLGLGGWGSFW